MYKAYKFRIYPDNHQRILFNQSFGCVRFIYNHYLEQSKETGYKNAKSYCYDYAHNLKYQYPFLMSVDSILIRNSIFNLDNAYQKFFNKESDFPKYKSKISRNSYTTNAIYRKYKDKNYCNIEVDLDRRLLKLPKIKWISIRGYRKLKKLDGRIMDASLSEIIRQLQYKSKWKGKYFYQVDTYYPSSQICSVCNHKDSKYKDIKERIYYCSNCNSILDRDLNASINIMFEGIKLYMNDININYNFS